MIKRLRPKIRVHTLIGLGLLLVLLPLVIFTLYKPNSAEAEWMDEAYAYRQRFTFTHNADISADRAITFSLDTAELITAGVMQSDCDDTRFTDVNGKVLLYDLTGTCNNAATTYEVIFPEVFNDVNAGYVYYGNPSAINAEIDSTIYTALTPSGGDPSITTRTNEEAGPGPVAWWKFDEGVDNTCANGTDDVCDNASEGNDGALGASTADPAWKSEDFCIDGKCLEYDGDDYVNMGDVDALDFAAGSSFAVCGWVKGQDEQQIDRFVDKMTTDAATNPGYYLGVNASDNAIFKVRDASDNQNEASSSLDISDHKWHHLCGQKNGSTLEIYVDGVLDGTGDASSITASFANSKNFTIGCKGATVNNCHEGFIDEVKVYKYARSASQVKADFLNQVSARGSSAVLGASDSKAFLSDGLVGYWPMEDDVTGNGQTITDVSGNGLNGTTSDVDVTGMNCGAAGRFGYGCDFDSGDDSISVAYDSKLDVGGELTLAGWIYLAATTTDDDLFRYQSSLGTVRYVMTTGSGDEILFGVNTADSGLIQVSTANNLTSGNWYHFVGTYDGSNVNAYINGELAAQNSATGAILTNDQPLYIGSYSGDPSDDKVDELRLYNRALSPAEVRDLYNWAPGPIGHWKMDENTGTTTTYDSSTNANNGTLNSITEESWVPGKYGSAIDFDGSADYVSVADGASFSVDRYTISAWFKRDSDTGNTEFIFDNRDATDDGYRMAVSGAGDILECSYNTTDSISTTTFTVGTWYHVACTSDGSNQRLYVNGVLEDTDAITGSIAETTNATIGRRGYSAVDYFNGKIDDLKLYNYTRTSSQVIEDMNASHPLGGSPVGSQLAYWSFDEMSGQNIYDRTNSGIDIYRGWSTAAQSEDPTWKAAASCKINGCLEYDGSSDRTMLNNNDPELEITGNMTFTAWINADTIGDEETIVFKGEGALETEETESNNAIYTLRWDTTSGNDLEYLHEYSTGSNESNIFDVNLSTSTWYHVAFTRDVATNSVILYVDGINKGEFSYTNDPTGGSTGEFAIGADDDGTAGTLFDGHIDEVKIYNDALTQEEILIDMNAGAGINIGTGQVEADELTDTAGNPPAGYWPMNDNTGTTAIDTSGNETDGTLTNMDPSTDWVPGKYGSALDFDSTDDVLGLGSGSHLAVYTNSAITVSTWIYARSDGEGNTGRIIGASNGSSGYLWFTEGQGSTGVDLDVQVEHATTDAHADTVGDVVPLNTWTHVAFTYNEDSDNRIKIYVNGQLQALNTDTAGVGALGDDSVRSRAIGNISTGTTTDTLDGMIDEFKIWNYALTQAQIAYDYNRGRPVAWYKFDECQGTTANDATANGYDGTITIGATGTYTSAGTCGSGTSTEAWNAGTTGKRNSAIALDGSNDEITGSTIQVSDYPFSVSAWLKTSDSEGYLFMLGDASANTSQHIRIVGGYPRVYSLVSGAGGNATGTTLINDGNWHHIAAVWSASNNRKVYVDGVLNATNTSTVSFDAGIDNWCVGDECSGATFSVLSGLVDDLRVYNYALSDSQIKKLMNDDAGVRFGPLEGSP